MAQKPMLRAEVYAHVMRASQNRKKGSVYGLKQFVYLSYFPILILMTGTSK